MVAAGTSLTPSIKDQEYSYQRRLCLQAPSGTACPHGKVADTPE